MKSTFSVKSQQNWGRKVNPFSMDWGDVADGTFTILKD